LRKLDTPRMLRTNTRSRDKNSMTAMAERCYAPLPHLVASMPVLSAWWLPPTKVAAAALRWMMVPSAQF
jgi:hypothetical protein